MSKKTENTKPEKASRLHVESDLRAGLCTMQDGTVVRATRETCEKNGWTWTSPPPPPPTK